MYDKVQNTSLQGFVQDALWKKLAIAPVIECLNSNCLAKYQRQVSSKQQHENFPQKSNFP